MSTVSGTSCLLADPDDLTIPARRLSDAGRRPRWITPPTDPGDDAARARLAATVGRRAETCCICGVFLGEMFTRRSKSGKTFCRVCADRAVATYNAAHRTMPPASSTTARERTGTAYLQERERYAVRFHAGNGRWQVSDTQTRRWTRGWHAAEGGAIAIAAAMNAAWRTQIDSEKYRFSTLVWLRAEGL